MENKAAGKGEKWNWLAAFACFSTTFTTIGVLRVTGVLFPSITEVYGVSRQEAAWPFFVRRSIARLTGLIVGLLSEYFDARIQVIGGIVLCSIGIGSCYFAKDVFFITLTFGILYGFGSGIVRTSNQIIINRSFSRYRTVSAGVILAGSSVGTFVFPPFADFLLDEYGLNGTFLVISGILLQGLVAAALYRDTNAKSKKPKSLEPTKLPDNTISENDKKPTVRLQIHNKTNETSLNIRPKEEALDKRDNKEIVVSIEKLDRVKCNGNKDLREYPKTLISKNQSTPQRGKFVRILLSYLGILRFPMFYIIFISSSSVGLSLYTYLTTIVDHGMDCGIERHKVIYLLSACGISELCGRLGCGWITDLGLLKRTSVIKIASVAIAVTFVVTPWTDNYILLVALAVCLGFLASCLVVNTSVLYVEYLGKDNVPYAVGLGTTFSGSISLTLPSVIGNYVKELKSYEVVVPQKVNENGFLVSNDLSHYYSSRSKRSISASLHYRLITNEQDMLISLRPNHAVVSPGYVLERYFGIDNGTIGMSPKSLNDRHCYFKGDVRNSSGSNVALSTCNGLMGIIRIKGEDYFIEPVKDKARKAGDKHPHLLYKRSATKDVPYEYLPKEGKCGNKDDIGQAITNRAQWEKRRRSGKRGRRKRSVSLERNVETLVVADKMMVDYYSDEDIETYILTVMNVVSSLYHDASIGNAVNIVVVRLILLENEGNQKDDPEISHDADHTLKSFCKWQKYVNYKDESHPNHHDVAVLLTRYNICTRINEPCSTLGLAEVAGMCQPHRSCNVNEDTGLGLAYTIAHEMGHNFGMSHDGIHNGCQAQQGERQHLMSPHLNSDASPFVWSNCSRLEITKFLDRDWGSCLDDEPSDRNFSLPELPPGTMYNADHQCRLQYGPDAEYCEGREDMCQMLWCRYDNRCVTRLEPAADGTLCDRNKWCYMGKCVPVGERPAAINGEWGPWSPWTQCSRTCDAGVMRSERHCDNPMPANGGRFCIGERKRYRICKREPCLDGSPSFRSVQCSHFDNIPYKGESLKWYPVSTPLTPCQLHCKPKGKFFTVMLSDTVEDGTPCNPGTNDMCINGKCRRVACDWVIDSSAQEDRCGICHGDGTLCQTIRGKFLQRRGIGYVEIVKVPKGARNIKVEELGEATNYVAIQDKSGEFQLNGQWYIQWSGEYVISGTTFYYNRVGEKEDLHAPGPTKEVTRIMLLFQTENPGFTYEYTIPIKNATRKPEFHWEYVDWSVCSTTCNAGIQVSQAKCFEKEAGLVENSYCDSSIKPPDRTQVCNRHECPARWWSGPWQHCSVSCGDNGVRRRTVICIRSLGPDEQMALPDEDCDISIRPPHQQSCRHKHPCLMDARWETGNWTDNCDEDPCSYQTRHVYCSIPNGLCHKKDKPTSRRRCSDITCGVWAVGNWSECTGVCGNGHRQRTVICIGGVPCHRASEPPRTQVCNPPGCHSFDDNVISDSKLTLETKDNRGQPASHKTRHRHGEGKKKNPRREEERPHSVAKDLIIIPMYEVRDNKYKYEDYDGGVIHPVSEESMTVAQQNNFREYDHQTYEWKVGMWSECSEPCGGGTVKREVLCFDKITGHMVTAELCDSSLMPAATDMCNTDLCAEWIHTDWSECSSSCGNGWQHREVYCPRGRKCNHRSKPPESRACMMKKCEQWIVGPWSHCSVTCGEGYQTRHVKCINIKTQAPVMDCSNEQRPEHYQVCRNEECREHKSEFNQCEDKLEKSVCRSLQHMCNTWYFKAKCCRTCTRLEISRRRKHNSKE